MIPDIEPKLPRTTRDLILTMVQPFRLLLGGFFLLTFLGTLAWIASPYIVSLIVTHLGKSTQLDRYVWTMVVLFFLIRIADELFWRLGELLARSYKPQMVERVRTILFAATLKHPHEFFVNASTGRIAHWINATVETTNEFVDTTFWNVWGRTLSLVLSAFFLYLVHWSLALLFVVWLVLLFWFNIVRGKRFSELIAKQSDQTSLASGIVVDSISNNLSVRVYNAGSREQKRLMRQQGHIITTWRDSWWQNWVTNIVKGQSAALASGLALVLVLLLFTNGIVPLGGILLFVAYYGDASSSLWELAWSLDNYYRNFGTIQNALDGLRAPDERTGDVVPAADLPAAVELELDQVSFAYPDQPETLVLDRVSLHLAPGEKIGVVGHSGAGKSTLIGLLLGFYPPTSGHIMVGDDNAADKDPSFIRSVSAFVPQDTNLFNRTILENVAYARPAAGRDDVNEALRQAEALDFVEKLPKGLDTLVGERGVKLSGGQRQRIAIARAILKDAPLLLLDEATSALDSVSEQAIQKSLYHLMQRRTTIVIAHRLSTLKHLDRIVVLEGGKVAEFGTHDELLAANGIYADLWQRQKDGFIADDDSPADAS
jgi:ATP-binding cassette subfamily B protein